MDNMNQADSMKTPKRARRLSSKEFEETSQARRSTRKTAILQEIEETDNISVVVRSVTPKLIDAKTPSRSDALATALTPRRSVRKSIKPVQEYENIIAQKGICSKRTIISSLEDSEEEAPEGKWVPAVIGRVSTKRGKKGRRTKKKQLQRQGNILEVENVDVIGSGNQNQLNDDNEEKRLQQQTEIDTDRDIGENYLDKKEDIEYETKESDQIGEDEKLNEDPLEKDIHISENEEQSSNNDVQSCNNEEQSRNEKEPCNNEKQSYNNEIQICNNEKQSFTNESHNKDEEPLERSTSKDKICCGDVEEDVDLKLIDEHQSLPFEMPPTEVHKDENALEILDSSVESGDIEMETMPVTADDCMESLKTTPLSSPNKTASALSTVHSTKKEDDSDCIMISFNDSSNTEQADDELQKPDVVEELQSVRDFCDSAENNMPTLLVCSDDEDDLEEVFGTTNDSKGKSNTELTPLVEKENDAPLNSTFDASDSTTKTTKSPIEAETPKLRPSMTRVPTPFKSGKSIIPDIITESQEELDSDNIPELLMEPRETKLKSSRKRSFSFCVDRPRKCVTFHSPANTTVAIFDGDLMKAVQEDAINITERRKRSLSVTETEREVVAYFKERTPFEATPSKRSKLPDPHSKSKMPNFAAIHQQQFQRMESIADHVARKAERAKILSNSITKVKPTSVQKGLPIKNAVLRDCNQSSSGQNKAVPKARQRIELSGIGHNQKAEANNSALKYRSTSRPDLSEFHDFSLKLSAKMSSSSFAFTGTKPRLPKPRFDATLNTLKADIKVASKTSANTITASGSQTHAILPGIRPRFNTSTVIDRQPPKGGEKLDDRRKRYLDMYKSRSAPRTGEKKGEILKGVRTNRRFELQMMCRNRPN